MIEYTQDGVGEIFTCMSARQVMKSDEASSVGWECIFVFWIIYPMGGQSHVTALVLIGPEILGERNLTSSAL